MRRWHRLAFSLLFTTWIGCSAQASDITVRVDAHDVARNRVHTDLVIAVKPGPLTLAFAKWIPGEHAPSGALDTLIGLEIKANGAPVAWSRDPLNLFQLRLVVPGGADHLDVAIESGLPIEGMMYTSGQTNSSRLAIISWNEFLLYPKGVDADTVSVDASLIPPSGWTVACALESNRGMAMRSGSRRVRWPG
jgi:hypothetical protein